MTGLVFLLEEERVSIGMDTLMHTVKPDGSRRAHSFTSKMHLLPHAHAVLCGTGVAEIVLRWYSLVELATVANDLEVLDRLAEEHLPKIWGEHKRAWAARGVEAHGTTTVYQFGFLRREQRYAGFAYRSAKDFVSERLDYGFGMKPNHAAVLDVCQRFMAEEPQDDGFVERLFVALFESLKQQDERPEETSPVGIGGEIHVLKMEGGQFALSVVGRFEDYEEDFDAMIQRLSEENAPPTTSSDVNTSGESD